MAAKCDGGAAGEGNQRHGPLTDMIDPDLPLHALMMNIVDVERYFRRKDRKGRKEERKRRSGKAESLYWPLARGPRVGRPPKRRSGCFLKESTSPNSE